MTRQDWLILRNGAMYSDPHCIGEAYTYYCNKKGLKPTDAETRRIAHEISPQYLVKWIDVSFNINLITKGNVLVKAF